MKNVLIVASTELEPVLVHRLSETGKVQFRKVPSSVVSGYEGLFKHTYDYGALKDGLKQKVQWIMKKISEEMDQNIEPDDSILRKFAFNPEKTLENTISYLDDLTAQFNKIKEPYDKVVRRRDRELENDKYQFETQQKKLKHQIMLLRAKTKSLQALNPSQLKKCITAGIVTNENREALEGYLQSNEIKYKAETLTENEVILFILDSPEKMKKVTNLFTVYEVEDIYEVFESGELLLVLDEEKMKSAIDSYYNTIAEQENKLEKLELNYEKMVESVNSKYANELKPVEKKYDEEYNKLLRQNQNKIKAADFIVQYLEKYSDIPVQRNPVVSILYAWFEDAALSEVSSILEELKGKDDLIYKVADVSGKELKEAKKEN